MIEQDHSPPLVSVGVPVYNAGARDYLRVAVDALLAQDYRNIEIIFCDDGSTDDTPAICNDYVQKDTRCRYHRHPSNIGAAANFNSALALGKGEFFMWAAFDDIRGQQFISKCVEALRRNSQAVMCCTDVDFVDQDGQPLPRQTCHPVGDTPGDRVAAFTAVAEWVDVYSLFRRDVLLQTTGFQPIFGGDVILTLEVALRGPVAYIPEKLWTVRIFTNKSATSQAQTLEPLHTRGRLVPSFRNLVADFIGTIMKSPLSLADKLNAVFQCLSTCLFRNVGLSGALRCDRTKPARLALRNGRYGHLFALCVVWLGIMLVRAIERLGWRPK